MSVVDDFNSVCSRGSDGVLSLRLIVHSYLLLVFCLFHIFMYMLYSLLFVFLFSLCISIGYGDTATISDLDGKIVDSIKIQKVQIAMSLLSSRQMKRESQKRRLNL